MHLLTSVRRDAPCLPPVMLLPIVDERIQMCVEKVTGEKVWKNGFIKKRNFNYGGHIPSSYTVKIDSKRNPVMNVINVSLRKVSHDDGVDEMVSLSSIRT